jgi:hypothetical protein
MVKATPTLKMPETDLLLEFEIVALDAAQLFSLWRSGIKLRSIASLVFASNPLGEAGSWLIGAL